MAYGKSKDRGIGPTAVNQIKSANMPKKYCRFKRNGIKYIDYKDPDFLRKFLNDQGKILPRRITGTSISAVSQWPSSVHVTLAFSHS